MPELKLKTALADWGITQSEVAQAVDVSPATICLIANHNRWPITFDTIDTKNRIEQFLIDRLGRAKRCEIGNLWEEIHPAAGTKTGSEADPQNAGAANTDNPTTTEDLKMLTHAEYLTPQAKQHFGITRDPFRDDVETPEDVYLGEEHAYALEAMTDALLGHRIVAVTGESGSGKTTIRRLFAERHSDSKRYSIILPYMLGNDEQGRDAKPLRGWDIQEAIIATLDPNGKVPQSRQARARRVDLLLRRSCESGRKNVVVIDQAHKVPSRTLVFLKELHDLELGMRRMVGVILIGQPELETKMDIRTQAGWDAREFIQRCEKATLSSLDRGMDLEAYLDMKFARLRKQAGDILEPDAYDRLRSLLQVRTSSRGDFKSFLFPLAIGNLITKAMNLCAAIGKPKVGGDQIKAALGALK